MKRFIINICLILTFVLIYILQSNFFIGFRIAGIMPNVFVIYILFIGLFAHKIMGPVYGIICGIFLDFFLGKKIGINSIMLGAVGIMGIVFDRNFSKENRITLMVMVLISTICFEVGSYILNYFINKSSLEWLTFAKILAIECVYNLLLTLILYPIMQILGNKIEKEYKGNKILTRYF